jgi:tetratricopeptide (TPR) repeat protein
MAWNNACIHAHALGDYKLAVELADGGQPFGPENPYIYHSAACAYAAVGQIDRALEQVARAIEHDYEHAEKMETDPDLAALQRDPRFSALFVEWRTRRADLN